jgi:hypothetical protein
VGGQVSSKTPFIERNTGNHPHVVLSALGEEFILRRLIKNVVNHLHDIDDTRACRRRSGST